MPHIGSRMKAALLSNAFFAFLGKIVSVLSGLALSILVTRLLSPQDAGLFFLAASVATFFATFSLFGFNQVAIRFIAEAEAVHSKGSGNSVAKTILSIWLIAGLATSIAYISGIGNYLAIIIFHSMELEKLTLIVGCWFFFLALQMILSDVLRGFNRINSATLVAGAISGVINVVLLGFLFFLDRRFDVITIMIISIVSVAIVIAGALFNMYPMLKSSHVEFNFTKICNLSSVAWPIWASNLSVFFLTQANLWVVAANASNEEVSLYSIATRTAGIFAFTTTILYSILPPVIAKLHAQNEHKELEKVLRTAASVNTVIMLPAFILVILRPDFILTMLFGPYYSNASQVFVVLSFGHLVNLVTGVRGYVLMMSGHEMLQLQLCIASSLISLLLGYVGMKLGGILWSAIGVTVALTLQCIFEMIAVNAKIGISTHSNVRSILNLKVYLQ